MKKILVVVFLSFLFKSLYAQDDASIPGSKSGDSKGVFFIQATAGIAFPMGDFGNNDALDSPAGYANPGVHMGAEAGLVILKELGLGLGGNFSVGTHPIKEVLTGFSYGILSLQLKGITK